jgi:WD40 repeat protein
LPFKCDLQRYNTDTITGMSVSPDGTHVLTNAMDCTLRMWDMVGLALSPTLLSCVKTPK